jgi:hypothetical protein
MDPKRAIRPLKPLPALIVASHWLQLPVVFPVSAVAIASIDRLLQPPARSSAGNGAH